MQEAYEDDEQLAIVTVIEELDPDQFRHSTTQDDWASESKSRQRNSSEAHEVTNNSLARVSRASVLPSDTVSVGEKTKVKPKKVTYEIRVTH